MTEAVAARPGRSVVQRMAAVTVTVVVIVVALAVTAFVGTRSVHNGIVRRTTELVPVLVALDRVDAQLDRLAVLLTAGRLDGEAAQQVTAALDEARRAGEAAARLDAGVAGGTLARQAESLDVVATVIGPALPSGGELPGATQQALEDARAASRDARATVTQALLDDMRTSRSQSWRFLVIEVVLAAVAIVVVTWRMRATALAIANPLRALRDRILRARDDVARRAAADEPPNEPSPRSSVLEVNDLADQFDRLSQDGAAWLRREQQAAEQRRVLLDIAAVTRQSGAGPVDLDRVCELLAGALHADRSGLVATIEGRTWASWWQASEGDAMVVDWLTERLLPEPVESMRFLFDGPTRIDDLAAHPVAVANDFDTATAGVRSILTSPVVAGPRTIGVLGVTMSDRPRAWTDDDAALVQLVADQVAQVVAERQYIESLQDLDRQKSEFLANASHELRTPLTSIAGYLELLTDGDFGPLTAEQERAHDVIARNTTRLRDLIEDILVLSRIEGDRLRPDLRPLDVRDVIERVRGDLAPVAGRKGVSLAATDTEIGTAVLGDREQLERALTNVVANAVKFTPPGGAVTVELSVSDTTAAVTCRDTGIGIPAVDLPLTGTKFFRARNAAEHAIPGTGIGLTIVRSILAAHGGQMTIDSVEGEGTTVALSLPLSGP